MENPLLSATYRTPLLPALLAVLAACAGSTTGEVTKTFHDGSYDGVSFRNILVIFAAGGADFRTLFERKFASSLQEKSGSATAYYAVAGRNQPITRSVVTNAVRSRGFDAVLLTRPVNPNLPVVDLFRFDYAELNQLGALNFGAGIELMTEMYAAAEEKRIWAIRSTSAGSTTEDEFANVHVSTIVSQLKKDRLVD